MTIRSTIGTAEITLESIHRRYLSGESPAPFYDLGDLMHALTEVLRAVGAYRLPEPAGRVLALLEGEDEEESSAEEEQEDNLPWSPPVAGATGSPLL